MSLPTYRSSAPSSAYSTPPASVDELIARVEKLLPEIGEGVIERERNRQLPYAALSSLAAAGVLTCRIPKAYGGPGGSVEDAISLLIRIAAVDSNAAQALRPGFGFLEGLLASHSDNAEQDRALWFDRYLQGTVVGNAGWEVGGANGSVSARLVREGDHYRVNGSKYYSTGALYADWVMAIALDENDQPLSFVLPRDREGLELIDDFDAMGQRLTASGTTHLNNVAVYPEELRPPRAVDGKRSIITPFVQLFLGAVEAGIARNALNDAKDFAQNHARPIVHSSAKRSVDDPYVELSVGDISARAYAAEAVVLRAAQAIDRAWRNDLDVDSIEQAAIEVAQAQYIAAESALKAAELVFDVGGASATGRSYNLDRHWRNARTVANHNPRHWKAAAVGASHLKGTQLPTSGLF
ncbi:acyl-CoA dehydrogenase family protein [Pseudomonas sp. CCC3.1]|uniref:acyl-CoA dehydrogenase family protein n=1 Tax=Pseudomonas sp. CCC3.1 TaxID=3048607 RepID=UPI002AC92B81|nr:acyl-CoA dehydrogenase family protein [Pseudomonas sp. CCC3.1]MEB0204034.1 acyl-CoA dehydrogenase family protein [Pseudomonas sp. CCC3.1]WPX35403.1 acyl-CoA dehydrogenase family protein [Pseudomonas sp. CCC3.1]